MSDRPNFMGTYGMLPNNNLQMGMAQQVAQQQQSRPQGIPGVGNSDNQQMWQNLQNNYQRVQGAGDAVNPQMNPQLVEYMRNTAMNHSAQAQNHQQNQATRQFPNVQNLAQFPAQNMHQPNQPFQPNTQKPQGFPQQQQQQQQFPGQMNQLTTPMLNRNTTPAGMIQNTPDFARQIALLAPARNQQPQNGPTPVRLPQQMQNMNNGTINPQLPFQPGLLPQQKLDGVRPQSIGPPIPQDFVLDEATFRQLAQQFVQDNGRQLSVDEIQSKLNNFQQTYQSREQDFALYKANNPADPQGVMSRWRLLKRDKQFVERMQKLLQNAHQHQLSQQQQQQQSNNNGVDMSASGMNHLGMQNQTVNPSMQGAAQHNISQAWLNNNAFPKQPNQLQAPNHQTPSFPGSSTATNLNANTQMMALFARQQQQQQQSSSQTPINNGMAQMHPGQQALQTPMQSAAPLKPTVEPILDQNKFNETLARVLQNINQQLNPQFLQVDNRSIDLHKLHCEVLRMGGERNVTVHDYWPVVAGKLGWVQFPGNGNEPGRSAPSVASHISHIYNTYLSALERMCFNLASNQQQQQQQALQLQQQQQQQRNQLQLQNTTQLQQQRLSQIQNQQNFIKFAHLSDEELRNLGLPEPAVQKISAHRPQLLHARQQLQNLNNSTPAMAINPLQNGQAPSLGQLNQPQQNANGQMAGPIPPRLAPAVQNLANQQLAGQAPGQGQGPATMENGNMPPGPSPMNYKAQLAAPGPQRMQARMPTDEMFAEAQVQVKRYRQEISQNRNMTPKELPESQKEQYMKDFEELLRLANEMDKRMDFFHAVFNEEGNTKKYISLIYIAQQQRVLLGSSQPKYIFDMQILGRLLDGIKYGLAMATKATLALQARGWQPSWAHGNGGPSGNLPPGGMPPGNPPPQLAAPPLQQAMSEIAQSPFNQQQIPPPRPPTIQPPAPPMVQQSMPAPPPPVPTPQMQAQTPKSHLAPPPPKRQIPAGAATSPSPGASASTPAPSAPTPSHVASSPQTPKSPKTKAAPKKVPRRKMSKAQPAAAVEPSAPAVSTPSTDNNALKRSHEEETHAESAPADRPPSPKRVKTEIATTPAPAAQPEVYVKPEEVEKFDTTEEAAKFFDSTVAMLTSTPNADMPPELNDMLESVLKSVGSSYEAPAPNFVAGSSLDVPGRTSPKPAANEDFIDFFDFSRWAQADDAAPVNTPELEHTSSTNPSPESNADADAHHHSTSSATNGAAAKDSSKVTTHDINESLEDDPLRLGFWGEIDGGVSQYFVGSEGWKWEGPMTTLDTPWAISSS